MLSRSLNLNQGMTDLVRADLINLRAMALAVAIDLQEEEVNFLKDRVRVQARTGPQDFHTKPYLVVR